MHRRQASEFDQQVLDLYDDYAHGRLNRRDYIKRLGAFAVGGVTVEALLESLSPNYTWAEQVKPDDERIVAERVTYQSPDGAGEMKGLLARPAKGEKFAAVLVIHENRGLNPYIEDVARRLAVAGFLALAPDALTPLGGYPGNDDDGRAMQRQRSFPEMAADFVAGAKWLDGHKMSTGKVGAVGFCFGGGMVYQLALRIPEVIDAGVPFYGRQPELSDVPKIEAPLLIHNGSLDRRIMAAAPAFEKALKENDKPFTAHVYEGSNHGFHNDTTPRYDEKAAELAWERTIAFFNQHLREGSAKYTTHKDLAYADKSKAQKLDLYLPEGKSSPRPVVVFVHGGGFKHGDKGDRRILRGVAEATKRGYAFASVNYRLSGEAKFPACIQDVKAAIRYLRANAEKYNLDEKKIGAWGASAGGHLVALLGTTGDEGTFDDDTLGNAKQSSTVQAVVNWFGPINFLTIDKQYELRGVKVTKAASPNSLLSELMGKPIDEVPEKVAEANPESYISAGDPPFLIQHGTVDRLVPFEQSEELASKLKAALGDDKVTFDKFEGAGHGGPRFAGPKNLKKVFDFFDKHLK